MCDSGTKIFQRTRQSRPSRDIHTLRQKRPVLRARQREDASPSVNKRSPRQLAIANPAALHRQKISLSANPQSKRHQKRAYASFFHHLSSSVQRYFSRICKAAYKSLAEFRARRREIKWKSCYPAAPPTGNIPYASQVWNFAPPAQNYARSRGASPLPEKASAFSGSPHIYSYFVSKLIDTYDIM
mgnify:FL=1